MKLRFCIFLSLFLAIPSLCLSVGIPTLDIPGTMQAAAETVQTAKGVEESITQVKGLQAYVTKIGNCKETVTKFITEKRELVEERMRKINEYRARIQQMAAAMASLAAEAQQFASTMQSDDLSLGEKIRSGINSAANMADSAGTVVGTGMSFVPQKGEGQEDGESDGNTPDGKTPKTDTPKADTPKADTPKADTPQTDTPADDSPTPSRKSFSTGFGYGQLRQTTPLAFAFAGRGSKSGTTEENVLIVPDHLSFLEVCGIDYEQALEKGALDRCLKNTVAKSKDLAEDEKSVYDKTEAATALQNGLLEYMAALYFEAMNIYNETLDYKNNAIDPIITSPTDSVDTSWRLAKEMHMELGKQFNNLNRLWGRNLAIRTYGIYASERFTTDAEKE